MFKTLTTMLFVSLAQIGHAGSGHVIGAIAESQEHIAQIEDSFDFAPQDKEKLYVLTPTQLQAATILLQDGHREVARKLLLEAVDSVRLDGELK